MNSVHKWLGIPIALVLALGGMPVLAGCAKSLDDNTGASMPLPAGFPADIPLIDGNIISATVRGSDTNQTWFVMVAVPNLDTVSAFDSVLAQLEAGGYHATSQQCELGSCLGALDNGIYIIDVSVSDSYQTAKSAPKVPHVTYEVAPAPAMD